MCHYKKHLLLHKLQTFTKKEQKGQMDTDGWRWTPIKNTANWIYYSREMKKQLNEA